MFFCFPYTISSYTTLQNLYNKIKILLETKNFNINKKEYNNHKKLINNYLKDFNITKEEYSKHVKSELFSFL
jgi:hypothetical protein